MSFLLNRRSLLRSAAGAFALASQAKSAPLQWALLSDTHIAADPAEVYRGFRPADNLKRAVSQVVAANPQAAIVNGDLARLLGKPDDYATFLSLIQPITCPIGITLGNHDNRENALASVSRRNGRKEQVKDRFVTVIDTEPVRFLLLDSLLETNLAGGLLGKPQREWLSQYLDDHGSKPTIVFVHHSLGDTELDLFDANRLLDIVLPRKQVKALVYGHTHTWRCEKERDLHLINLPAVGYNFADSEPIGWIDAQISAEEALLTLHVIGGPASGDGKTTSLRWRQ